MYGYGFHAAFDVFPVLFAIVAAAFIVLFVVAAVKGIGQWNKNNRSPRLTVEAAVVGRRTDVSHHQHANAGDSSGAHGFHTSTSTRYYVTFQVDSGDRMEFLVSGDEYGMLIEGDRGRLSFQGTRYLGFERT